MTQETIKGYGQFLSNSLKDVSFDESEFRFTADVGNFVIDGNITTGLLIGKKRELVLSHFERHLKTPELLVALENDALIALAKPSENEADIKDITLFSVKQGDSFVLDKGTWHWVPFPVNADDCKFLVVFRENTGKEDGGVIQFLNPVKLG